MLIGILEAGKPPVELFEKHGSYGDMFQSLLSDSDNGYQFTIYNVMQNQLPTSVDCCDGWIITGSKHCVGEQLSWMQSLKAFILDVYHSGPPLFGVCFGHQIIAEALGGVVQKNSTGWGVGIHSYEVEVDLGCSLSDAASFYAMHQDQVVEIPECAQVWLSSSFCKYAGLLYGDNILSLQPHPEFTEQFERELIELRTGNSIPEKLAKSALMQLDSKQPGSAKLVEYLDQFWSKRSD